MLIFTTIHVKCPEDPINLVGFPKILVCAIFFLMNSLEKGKKYIVNTWHFTLALIPGTLNFLVNTWHIKLFDNTWHFKLFDNQWVVVLLMKKSHDFFIFPLLSCHVAVIQIVFLRKYQVKASLLQYCIPHLQYAITSWEKARETYINKAQVQQNRLIRILSKTYKQKVKLSSLYS